MVTPNMEFKKAWKTIFAIFTFFTEKELHKHVLRLQEGISKALSEAIVMDLEKIRTKYLERIFDRFATYDSSTCLFSWN